ncbi:MAG: 3-hydroxyacyl-CoA dehydrogenase NAD-binding domain-containing protein, partial [Dehalococcoidales bacterium]|nr:3-hydroxyacyl-CoA dehydrogenase NAD-binding domain-containing protein [Dehalococcoidales bacterium]
DVHYTFPSDVRGPLASIAHAPKSVYGDPNASGVWRFRRLMPFFNSERDIATIGEGKTILQRADLLGAQLGFEPGRLHLQYEDIGAGLMGYGIGVEYARFGYEVTLYNTRKETSINAMKESKDTLAMMLEFGLITKAESEAAYQRLHPTIILEEAVKGADLVVESIREVLTLKQELFKKLDVLCPPSVILATNTSALRVTDITTGMTHPERVVATHYFQPPHFIPLVEVCAGQKTDAKIVGKTVKILEGMRKKVVVMKMELGGFIGNRIQGAIGRECQALVDRGAATPEMIDDVISYGFGRRMTYTGYFKRLDLIGLDLLHDSSTNGGGQAWPPLAEKYKKGELGMKTGKGFYSWSDAAIKEIHRRQNQELVRFMKYDMDKGLI